MKRRSLRQIILLSLITFGIYEIYWFASTRNEMVRKYRLKIPSAYYMMAVKTFQLIGAIVVTALLLLIIPAQSSSQTGGQLFAAVLGISVAMIILDVFYISRWLMPYARAVGRVCKRYKGTELAIILPVMLLPVGLKDIYSTLVIQNVFNKSFIKK